ncbi:uncharacterized membrane protein YdcZ (DUF606 family) [Spinactinospora alkalitolerans]|uniref:Uncharacterized membrane protein YdcZ (DUF606 family) n=1 Tax=Spinactinospora alkalitolerans TaxID=687207 RepID=A0A852U021_9ACTN|nr:cell wall anchor protein [Spinactinospora alkalitolerans]NYE48363.1 uncharacterized membrane protein YdcZ (DUF606 family) [Spinactinospora alkalitolerans]
MTAGQMWVLIGLGIFHGVNPGMGWLVAVSRGLQERSRAAVLRSLPAIAGGHAASIAVVAVLITATGSAAASRWFSVAGGAVVVAAGLCLLVARRHSHRDGVRLSLWQLSAWSFLMSSLHGAGLMLLPVLAGQLAEGPGAGAGRAGHGGHAHGAPPPSAGDGAGSGPGHADALRWDLFDATLLGLAATAVHTVAMFVAAGVVALVVHDFLGVHALRARWVTMDRVWAVALIGGGVFVLLTA